MQSRLMTAFCMVGNVLFTASNAYIIITNYPAHNACGLSIWSCLVFNMAVYWYNAIHYYATLMNINQSPIITTHDLTWQFISIITNIWSFVAYFNVAPDCIMYFDNKFPSILKQLLANIVFSFIIGIINIITVYNIVSIENIMRIIQPARNGDLPARNGEPLARNGELDIIEPGNNEIEGLPEIV